MSFKQRYILAEEAEQRIVAMYRKEKGDAAEIFNTAVDACQSIILDMYDNSSEDVVPVKHGRWTPVTNGRGGFECSICHSYAPSYQDGVEWLSLYCPNCGARMSERSEEC